MLKLKTLATGSSGNCYLLSTENETLILDCGIPIKEIKKGLNFDLSKVVGCVVTHAHKDHSLSVKDIMNMGIKVYEPFVFRKSFGGFKVQSFEVPHDNEPCVGYLITCPDGQKVLYATDFEYIKYNFQKIGIDHIIIECNYQQEYVNRDLPNFEHKIKGHCSLDTCKKFIEVNATDRLKTVLLVHMGVETCNAKECVGEIKKVVKSGVFVDYARKGLETILRDNICPF